VDRERADGFTFGRLVVAALVPLKPHYTSRRQVSVPLKAFIEFIKKTGTSSHRL
jgi:hypothetical protein